MGLGLVAAVVVGSWYMVGGGGESPEIADRSVAVLPFEAWGREEPGTFTAGMHAALSSRLANVSDLRVSPSRAVQAYEDTSVSMARIAGELGVGWVVAGNVQSTDEEVRVIVELVDPATGTQRWSDDYTRDLTTESLFDLQSEISKEIARSLEAELSAEERERIERRPTEDLDAYRLYARGRSELNTRTEEGMRQAVDDFQRAIERDSSYALAWSGLADAIGLLASKPYASFEGTLPDHEEAARRALDLDPDLAEAYLAEGYLHGLRDSLSARITALRRTLDLQLSHAFAKAELSDALESQERYVEAVRVAREAVRLAPRNPVILQEMGDQLRAVGLYDAAEAWDRYALEIEPGHYQPIAGLTQTLRLRGDPTGTLEVWENFRRSGGSLPVPVLLEASEVALQAGRPQRAEDFLGEFRTGLRRSSSESSRVSDFAALVPRYGVLLGLTELRLGNRERGRRLLSERADSIRAELQRSTTPSPQHHLELSMALAAMGQSDAAFRHLERWAASLEGWDVRVLLTSPFLDAIRSEPRFQTVLRQMVEQQREVREEVLRLGLDLFPEDGPSEAST